MQLGRGYGVAKPWSFSVCEGRTRLLVGVVIRPPTRSNLGSEASRDTARPTELGRRSGSSRLPPLVLAGGPLSRSWPWHCEEFAIAAGSSNVGIFITCSFASAVASLPKHWCSPLQAPQSHFGIICIHLSETSTGVRDLLSPSARHLLFRQLCPDCWAAKLGRFMRG